MRILFALVFLCLVFTNSFGQKFPDYVGTGIRTKTIVIKLKPEYRNLAMSDGINGTNYSAISSTLMINECIKLFPKHLFSDQNQGQNKVDLSLIYQIKYSANIDEKTASALLTKTGLFEYAEPRAENSFLGSVNDPKASWQFYLHKVKAYEAWDVELGDTNVVVGIVDNGTDRAHEDMLKNLYYNYADPIDGVDNDNDGYIDNMFGWDFGSNDNDPQWYPYGHGLFVAGIIGASQNNSKGIAGIGYNTKYMAIKADDTSGYLAYDYEGLVYAADHGCAVINCSWGGFIGGHFGQDIVNYATFNRNSLVVAAAGNFENSRPVYPASYKNVLSCAATDSLDQRAYFSTYGKNVDISAPGTWVYSTFVNNSYVYSHGTSFSAPCVAAGAALLKSKYPWMDALMLAEQLKVTSDNIDTISSNIAFADNIGFGRLNIYNALTDTTKPSIVMQTQLPDFHNDTLFIRSNFKNFLHETSSYCNATISTDNPNLIAINDIFSIGNLSMSDTISNTNSPFIFVINGTLPIGSEIDFKMVYSDTNYRGFEYFTIQYNNDCINLDTNLLDLTICSNGNLGFKNDKYERGTGLHYGNSTKSLISCAGLVIGNSDTRVSDNIYQQESWSNSFRPIIAAKKIIPALKGDQQIIAEFNDDSASFTKMGIKVYQNSYSFNSILLEKASFHNYTIKNESGSPLSTLYAGLYTDWDIARSDHNMAAYDSVLKLSYTWCTEGGSFGGILLLKGDSIRPYNFNNDGSDNSINITDGFIDFEKYQCLKNVRKEAGNIGAYGKDVSSLMSTGPYNLNSGDSIEIEFAIIAGDNLAEIKQVAQNVRNYYYNFASINMSNSDNSEIAVFPNPTSKILKIELRQKSILPIEISIYDSKMMELKNVVTNHQNPSAKLTEIDISNLNSGIYFIRIKSEKEVYLRKFVKIDN